MRRTRLRQTGWALLFLCLIPALASAEVSRVEIATRGAVLGDHAFGSTGPYERIVGRVFFSVDPANPRNRLVVDLDKAPTNAAGRVEFWADLIILRPRDLSKGNGVALIDVVNRGRKTILPRFDRATETEDFSKEEEFGDGFLFRQGYTLVWVGWEFDTSRDGAMRIEVPGANGVTGIARGKLVPNAKGASATFGNLAGYRPTDPASPENTLTVRETPESAPVTIPRGQWKLAGNAVTLDGGFEPGRTYELAYAAANPPISGLGFAAMRDTMAWLKYGDSLAPAKYAYAWGSSQSGRFLRAFLYHGFNADERSRLVFDAVIANVAGSARVDLNRRWATPTASTDYAHTSFPFADTKQRDPITGAEEGTLENPRAKDHQPKLFYTVTGAEYWGGGHAAALVHSLPDGSKDLALPGNVRFYFLAGSQHGPAKFPSTVTTGQQKNNPLDYTWTLRALLVAMDKWTRNGTAPPPSRYPRRQDATLVRGADVAFPTIAGVGSPRHVTAGTRAPNRLLPRDGAPGTPIPIFVPQVDHDGNERAGVRPPELVVPLATYTGWNFRNMRVGAPDELYPDIGSFIPFPGTKAERERTHDPRASIEERYPTREKYLTLVREAGTALVKEGYMLADDLSAVVHDAGEHWDFLVPNSTR